MEELKKSDDMETLENAEIELTPEEGLNTEEILGDDLTIPAGEEIGELDLEDIMKEFSDEAEPIREKTPEEILTAAEEEARKEYTPETVQEPEQSDAMAGGTVRFEAISQVKGTVRNAQPIDDDEDLAEPVRPVQEETTEPYSAQWEPEYEQPIAEYVPPNPIPFRPRSRLRELKKKLVEGPEKQYYDMLEQGVGKLQLAMLINLLLVLGSVTVAIMYSFNAIGEHRLRFVVFLQFWTLLATALLGSYQLIEGVTDLIHKRVTLNTALVFTFILCCVDGILCFRELRVPCCAAFGLQMVMSQWNTYHKRIVRMGQLDTMRKATRLNSLTAVPDYHEGEKGFVRGEEGQVEDFMDTLDQPSRPEKVMSIYALVAMGMSVVAGVVAGVFHGFSTGIQVASVTSIAALPASMFITLSRPMAVLEKRLHAFGTVLCGWQGVEGLCGKSVFPVDHNDLLPAGNIRMNGVKFFGSRQPDEVVAYATALIAEGNGSMVHLFTSLLDSRNGKHYPVVNFRGYEQGGIGGEVNGEPVLVGSISFLRSMGVDVPEGVHVPQAVCVAVDGEMCGLFAVVFEQNMDCAAGVATLCSYRGLRILVNTDDFMVTEEFLCERFEVKPKRVLIPEQETRRTLRDKQPEAEMPVQALVTGDGLAAYAYAVTGARVLKSTSFAGLIIHMIGGALGIGMMILLGYLGATKLLTPLSMFLYELVWLIPGFLLTEWTRSI